MARNGNGENGNGGNGNGANGNGNGKQDIARQGFERLPGFTPDDRSPMAGTPNRSGPTGDAVHLHGTKPNSGNHKSGNKTGLRKSERVKTMRSVAVASGGLEG